MILKVRAAVVCCALIVGVVRQAPASETVPSTERTPDTSIEKHRVPFDTLSQRLLSERSIGVASRAVRFDWRQKSVGVGLIGSQLFELNNFKSARYGLFARMPLSGWMGELSITRVQTWGSPSSDKLALTPYRQLGRPSRFELDASLAIPLVEGVGTARPGFMPSTQLVLSAVGCLRYLFYPEVLDGASVTQVARSFIAPRLSSRELRELEDARLGGMQIDRGRFNALAGLNLDIYFGSGGFVTWRSLVALPITGSEIYWWWEATVGAGWMF
ncbi:MAG: hypothetical protein SF187_10070 [Deltaproteobacteria bacterium]|nr:hypothetical protein [Deltaproteobacteria bacterium]